ncbi:hypothetical protein HJC23_012837 [Cyclotella cryptica]|uniref:Protein arginine N-methyltransferase 7 n=1 Tax=Cyclotella cryptica TaxID=29204 RepID=A0ABD3Q7J5_9STRA|eukprot:CCRYP_009409-RA/>CCRYP_009409-RA protein AED:0.01 eAED:-0.00 QI:0/-1/0/1/-1/1/1/0/976
MSSSTSDDIQTTLQQAIQSARYNEAVILSLSDHDHTTREIVVVPALDREHGGIVWRDASSESTSDDDNNNHDDSSPHGNDTWPQDDVGILRHLRTKLWAIPMLNDHVRNDMYHRTVRDACRIVVKRRMRDNDDDGVIRILDIGSGTGLLAMMAANHCRDAIMRVQSFYPDRTMRVQVTSCEMASAMARLARMTMEENEHLIRSNSERSGSSIIDGVDCGIVVVECHSTDDDFFIQDGRFENNLEIESNNTTALDQEEQRLMKQQQQQAKQPKKADICTSELLDSGLLGEGVLPSLRDAWERHLKPNALMLPRSARVVAVLVEGCPMNEKQPVRDMDKVRNNRLNRATSLFGPDLDSFQSASGGVWLATTAQYENPTIDKSDGVLLGVQCVPHDNLDQSATSDSGGSGITIPMHADALLDDNYRDGGFTASLADPFQEYDGYSFVSDNAPEDRNTESKSDASNENVSPSRSGRGIRPLTDPLIVLDFDFASGLSAFPPAHGRSVSTTFIPNVSGIIDGVLFWWELDLGDAPSDTYSTQPLGYFEREKLDSSSLSCTSRDFQWQDHWQQGLFLFGDSDRSRMISKGQPVHVVASHDNTSISFVVSDDDQTIASRPTTRRKMNDGSDKDSQSLTRSRINQHISPSRALQLNNDRRTAVLRDAILFALSTKGTNAPLLDLSDMSLCAMIAAVAGGATCVTSLESTMATLAATISQIGNSLPKAGATFQVIQALSENVTNEYISGGPAEIVVAEPYYQVLEGWHIQEALNYFYLVRSFKSRKLISQTAISIPSCAYVMACVVEFQDFSNAYGKVGDDVERVAGFGHKVVNYYGDRYHTYDLSLPLWQYRWKRLSKPLCMARFVYEGDTLAINDDRWVSTEFERVGSADAVVFWVDYLCRSAGGTHVHAPTNDRFNIISTSSSCHRQIVRKLYPPIVLTDADLGSRSSKFLCRSKFDCSDLGKIDDHCFSFKIVTCDNKVDD